jgi:hypothetical protein
LYAFSDLIEITFASTSVASPGMTTTNGKGAKSAKLKKVTMRALTAIGSDE